jgi:predicted metal-dependent peptidase
MNQNLILDISRITKKLLINDVFYGLFISSIEKKENKNIPLAAVGLNKATMEFSLLINPDEWDKYSDQVKYNLLKHEALHLTNFHLITMDAYPNAKMDNIACDIEINQLCDKSNLPEWGCFLEDFANKYPKLDWKNHAGRAHYYKELSKLSEKEKEELGIDEKAQHKWIITDGEGNPSNEQLTDAQKDAIRVQLEHTIESIAEEISKSQGNLPIEIQQLINGFVKPKPKFNYKKYISNFVGNSKQYMIGTTKLRENQRFEGAPKVILKPKSKILVCIDESGSVSENELFEFLNEIHHLSKKTDIEIRPFDTKVMKPVVYKPNSGQFKRTNCGGTYFTPVIEFYNKHPEFNSMLVFTDGEAETPPPCNKKMLWVISSNGNEESIKHHNTWIKIPKD